MESMQLSAYDFVIAGIVLLLVARGIYLGLLRQITPLLALYAGYLGASRYHGELLPFLSDVSDNPKVVFMAACVIMFAVIYLAAFLVGRVLSMVIEVTIAPWFDRILGAVLGGAKALLLVILIHMALGTLMAPENDMLRTCRSCPALNRLADTAREVIEDEQIREALRRQEPAIAIDEMTDLLLPGSQSGTGRAVE